MIIITFEQLSNICFPSMLNYSKILAFLYFLVCIFNGQGFQPVQVESKYVYLIKFWESSDEIMCIKFKMPTSATTLNGTTSVQNLELAEEAEHKEPAIVWKSLVVYFVFIQQIIESYSVASSEGVE